MRPLRLLFCGLLVMTMFGRGVGSPPEPFVRPVGNPEDLDRFAFRITAPPLSLQETPDGTDVRLRGFHRRERVPGAPDLPQATVLVAIPAGATPRLIVRPGAGSVRPGVVPRPVPTRRFVSGEASPTARAGARAPDEALGVERLERFSADPAIYRGDRAYPAALARLGDIGVLRHQRYVEVHLAPVRWDPSAGGLAVTPAFEVEVVFDGGAPPAPGPPERDAFESVYREAFVNYGQGTRFRLDAAAVDSAVEASALAPRYEGAVSRLRGTGAGIDDAGARRRIVVRQDGPVRLDSARMAGTGFETEPLSTWKLTNRGEEVPLDVHDVGLDDMLDPGDWVQFFGQALDDEPKAVLNTDLFGPVDLFEARDFTDDNVYFLTVEAGPRARMATRDATPDHLQVPPSSFEDVARAEVDDAWRPLADADPWSWLPTLTLGGTTERTDVVNLPGLATGTASARVRVQVQGRSESVSVDPDHATRVTLMNGLDQVLAVNDDDGTFDGRELYVHDFTWTWPGSGPQLSVNAKIKLQILGVPAPRNDVILDFIELFYPRSFTAAGDALAFSWADETRELEIAGLTTPSPRVYEITDTVGGSGVVDAVRLTGAEVTGTGPYTVRFQINDRSTGSPRSFVVAGDAGVSVPATADFTADTVSDLRDTTNQARLIVITHRDLLDDPANCADTVLDQLLAHRLAQGLTSRVVCMDDVQDEFNDGLPGPLAVKNFLAWVMSGSGWASPKPEYVVLLGDASYDYKAGTAGGTYVPTQILFKDDPSIGYYASDNVLAAVVGTDQLADLMIGRVSVRSTAVAHTVLHKLLDYEQLTPAGDWRGSALLMSDRGKSYDVFEASEFERINDIAAAYMQDPAHIVRKLQYWSGAAYCNGVPGNCLPGLFKADIKDSINGVDAGFDGAVVAQFTGHGNFNLWSDDVVFCGTDLGNFCPVSDTDDLANGLRLPWLLVHNCLTGGFHTTEPQSFGENWMNLAGGGAMAVYAPSGLGFRFIGEVVTESMWEDLFGPTKQRILGIPVMDNLVMLCGQGSIEACQYYVLLGDPSSVLQVPTPGAPAALAAVAGNGVVNLSWTASPTGGVTYRVYRSISPADAGQLVGTTAATSFADSTVINATTYYFHVVALDGDGFSSAWSNFNSDCDVSGPDCVEATPLNPNPPSVPTGLGVTDTETNGRLDVAWNVNPENDIDFYTVHWGTASGMYDDSMVTGKTTAISLTGLQNGVEYFVTVTATNTSGNTSSAAPEDSAVPTFIRGLKSPGFVSDLVLTKSGTDAVLSWGAITEDIYGKPESVASYEVYRGDAPAFVPSPATRIATVPGGQTTYTDTDALASAVPGHYLVRAVDADGNVGGLGNPLPQGIGDLRVDRAGTCSVSASEACRIDAECPTSETCLVSPADLMLSWPAVAFDFEGDPVVIVRYDVYASDAPFGREAIRDGSVAVLVSSTGSPVVLTPPAQDRHYSVIAVDAKGNESPF